MVSDAVLNVEAPSSSAPLSVKPPAVVKPRPLNKWNAPPVAIVPRVVSICTWVALIVLKLSIAELLPLSVMLAASIRMAAWLGSCSVPPASASKLPPVRVLPDRLVKVVGSMTRVEPFPTESEPLLVKVVA